MRGTERSIERKDIAAIDLFCGAGGLTRGLLDGGVRVVAGIDIDPACKYPYETNNDVPFIKASVTDLGGHDISRIFADTQYRVLAGCAPCQPFSTYTQGRDTSRDERWGLLGCFSSLVRDVRPDVVTMENVPQLKKHQVFDDFILNLRDEGYYIDTRLVYCPDYGLPQARTRLVLLASRRGPIKLIDPTHSPEKYRTVRETIGQLEPLEAGMASKTDPLHRAAKLSERNLKRIRVSKPGGTWRDWDPDLVTACHRSSRGASYSGVYGRMEWDKPSPTITTQCYGFGSGRYGHPVQNRAITLREAALLQTFPPDYRFIGPDESFSFKRLGDLIGNAVPVELGKVIATSIRAHLETSV